MSTFSLSKVMIKTIFSINETERELLFKPAI
jgi:hypothetical protein